MRLTNTIRQAFVRAALDDVPTVDYTTMIRKIATDDAIAQLPPKVRALYNDKELRGYIRTQSVYIGDTNLYIPTAYERWDFKFSDAAKAEVARLEALAKTQTETKSALRTKLMAVANAATTRKALLDMVPEFEKYLPPDEAAANKQLPAVANVLSAFVQAGWPKDLKKLTPEQKAEGSRKVAQLRQS